MARRHTVSYRRRSDWLGVGGLRAGGAAEGESMARARGSILNVAHLIATTTKREHAYHAAAIDADREHAIDEYLGI